MHGMVLGASWALCFVTWLFSIVLALAFANGAPVGGALAGAQSTAPPAALATASADKPTSSDVSASSSAAPTYAGQIVAPAQLSGGAAGATTVAAGATTVPPV